MDINFKKLINNINQIKGISKKQAEKIAISLLKDNESKDLINGILKEIDNITICPDCQVFHSGHCSNCEITSTKLTIVSNHEEYISLYDKLDQKTKYYILDIKRKSDFSDLDLINKVINKIITYISGNNIKEAFFLLSPTVENELIIRMVKEMLYKSGITNIEISKPNIGIPFGSSIEYSSEDTIREAVNKREKA